MSMFSSSAIVSTQRRNRSALPISALLTSVGLAVVAIFGRKLASSARVAALYSGQLMPCAAPWSTSSTPLPPEIVVAAARAPRGMRFARSSIAIS